MEHSLYQDLHDAARRLTHAIAQLDRQPPQASALSDDDAHTATKAAQDLVKHHEATLDAIRAALPAADLPLEKQVAGVYAELLATRAQLEQAQDQIKVHVWREMHYTTNAGDSPLYRHGEAIWLRTQATDSQRSAMLKSRDDAVMARSAADREVGHLTGERDELARQLEETRAVLSDLLAGAEQMSQSHADVAAKCRAALATHPR